MQVAKVVTPAEPSLAYRAASAGPDGTGCAVEIIELPAARRYRKTFAFLQLKPPALVPAARWRQCVRDGSKFLARWGEAAQGLNWSSADLFGLHAPPAKPHPSYSRLSRYDCTGCAGCSAVAPLSPSPRRRPRSRTRPATSWSIGASTSPRWDRSGRHSEKPVEIYGIIERMYPELFARQARPGWAAWGK